MRGRGLNDSWIASGFLKRRSNYSPVILFETTDPKRLEQLKTYVLGDSFDEKEPYDNVFVYDQWQGLARLNVPGEEGRVEAQPYRKQVGGSALSRRISGDEGLQLGNLKAVLKEVDQFLKQARTLLIIQNLSENREWETGLQAALRSWAIDPAIITRGSAVFLQTADADSILDDFTKELVVVISVDPASEGERRHVIGTIGRELGIDLSANRLAEIVMATGGLNLHQLESILLESYYGTHQFDLGVIKRLKSELVKKSGVLEVRDPRYSFSDIGGYDVVKDFIRRCIINVLQDSERASRFSLPLPKGILFFGPPGTGKSLFANALATEIRLPFINLLTENIYSKWLGESGHRMKSAVQMAEKMSPAIVFVDEIDRFGKRHAGMGDSAGQESKRVFSQFLEWLGNPERSAIIVGTTNVPDHLDEAFMRTGRFDYKVPFLYPGEHARLEVMLVHLGLKEGGRKPRAPLALGTDHIQDFLRREVVPLTRHFSCAELEELVVRAKRLAFDRRAEELGEEDFLAAARTFRVDAAQREETIETCLEQAARYTDDQTFLDSLAEEMGVDL